MSTKFKTYVCSKCGHELLAVKHPQPIRWSDGHVCDFTMSQRNNKTVLEFGQFAIYVNEAELIVHELDETGIEDRVLYYSREFDNAKGAEQVAEALCIAFDRLDFQTFKVLLCASVSMPSF